MNASICAFPGNEALAEGLRTKLRLAATRLHWRRFPDGESYVRFEDSPAGLNLAVVCSLNDPDAKAQALLFAAGTARELGAVSVGLVAPYLGYMRQDRRFQEGEAVTSALFAAQLSAAFDWLVTVDAHLHRRSSLSEIYTIPAQDVGAAAGLADWIRVNVDQPLVVGPDAESERWAAAVAAGASALPGYEKKVTSKTTLTALVVLLLAGAPALAQDAPRGRLLYETHCLACHYERIHKRDASRSLIKSHADLRVEVVQRAALTKQRFTVEDLDDIAEYLNRSHYRLAK